jgi:DNA/RNA endonuclease YhcR with UshA esterase domain
VRRSTLCTKYDQIKNGETGEARGAQEEVRNTYRILIRNSDEKRPLARPRRGWEDDIDINLMETEWEGVDWINVVQDLVNTVMYLLVP